MRAYDCASHLPTIPVKIGISDSLARYYDKHFELPPNPLILNGLVDSGASVTVISPVVVEKLRLESKGNCYVAAFSDEGKEYPNYDASLEILGSESTVEDPPFFRIGAMQVVGAPRMMEGIDVIIGTDVLKNFEFTVNIPAQRVVLRRFRPGAELLDEEVPPPA